MAKPKYSPETKLAVVNHYLSGKDGEQSTADLFGIERTSVRRWVRAWQFHGAEGLTAKNNHYSDEFKLVVVRAVISDRWKNSPPKSSGPNCVICGQRMPI
ncbi:hypothetical protein NUBL13936_49880 [Klebsiella pneumoniae]|nr:hypothetical protein NUBL13936_49880 [Klebsiella pneumoniae]